MSTMLEKAARAVCGNALGGYCQRVGGSLGCKRGRGESYNGTNCVASRGALMLSGHWDIARAVLTAIREPDVHLRCAGDVATMRHRGDAAKIWPEMIDAILKGPKA